MSAIDRLRTSLADDPETWSPALRMIAEAVLETGDPARIQQALDAHRKHEGERWAKALHALFTAPPPDLEWADDPPAGWEWPAEGLVEHTLAVAAEHEARQRPSPTVAGWADINVNDFVRVKLTPRGKAIAKAKGETQAGCAYQRQIDAEGWSEWQVWDLMWCFGPKMGNGFALVFETAMQVQVEPR
jgi:hypothetical protein